MTEDEMLAFHLIDYHGDPLAICRIAMGNVLQHEVDHTGPFFLEHFDEFLGFSEEVVERVLVRYESATAQGRQP
jgi:hypothetical protein